MTRALRALIPTGYSLNNFSVYVTLPRAMNNNGNHQPGRDRLNQNQQEPNQPDQNNQNLGDENDDFLIDNVGSVANVSNSINNNKENIRPEMIFKSKTAKPFHLKGRRPTNQNSVLFHERVQTDSRRFTFH